MNRLTAYKRKEEASKQTVQRSAVQRAGSVECSADPVRLEGAGGRGEGRLREPVQDVGSGRTAGSRQRWAPVAPGTGHFFSRCFLPYRYSGAAHAAGRAQAARKKKKHIPSHIPQTLFSTPAQPKPKPLHWYQASDWPVPEHRCIAPQPRVRRKHEMP